MNPNRKECPVRFSLFGLISPTVQSPVSRDKKDYFSVKFPGFYEFFK